MLRALRSSFILFPLCAMGLAGCSSSSSGDSSSQSTFSLTFPPVVIPASTEKYVCYSKTVDQDMAIDAVDFSAVPFVHHAFFSREMQPQPDGVAECDVVFRTSWLPLLLAGKGSASLQYPQGAANVIPKGAQIVLQLHLLNAGTTDATVSTATVNMHLTKAPNPIPVGIYAFGSQQLSLAPMAAQSIQYECTPTGDVDAFALFAHMHKLGTKLTLEVADANGVYKEVYRRDPYDFNNQYIDPIPLHVSKGTKTRVTCSYDNTTSATVHYGESTNDEMCYLAGFVPGQAGAFGCVQPPETDGGGAACNATANAMGISAPCTKGGGECGSQNSCSLDLPGASGGSGICTRVGCNAGADCGDGATCCSPAQGGGLVNVCLPSSCVPSDCTVKP